MAAHTSVAERIGTPPPAGQMLFEFLLIGIAFFSLLPVFALFPIGRSSGMQVSFFLAIMLVFLFILQPRRTRVRLFHLQSSDLAFLGFGLALFISTMIQFDEQTPEERQLFFNNYFGAFLPTLLIYFAVRIGMNSRRRIELMMKWLLISTTVSCVYGILDYIVTVVYGRNNLVWLFNNPAFTGLPWGSAVERYIPRAGGFMCESNIFIGLLLSVFPLALYRRSLILIGLLVTTMILTLSPLTLLIFPVLFWIFASQIGRNLLVKYFKPAVLFLILFAVPAVILLLLSRISLPRFFSESGISDIIRRLPGHGGTIKDGSTIVRLDSILVGWRLFLERPFLGHGYGTLSLKVPLYESAAAIRLQSAGQGVHSALMSLLATNGLMGVAAAIIWFVSVLTSARRVIRHLPGCSPLAWAWLNSFLILILFFCAFSSQWPSLYFVPVITAVTASLPSALMSRQHRN